MFSKYMKSTLRKMHSPGPSRGKGRGGSSCAVSWKKLLSFQFINNAALVANYTGSGKRFVAVWLGQHPSMQYAVA